MAQNLYDRADFYDAYIAQIDRSSTHDLVDDPAWSRLGKLVPDVHGMDVLDLGCGTGWFCRWAIQNGAKSVLGLDISEKMLSRAIRLTPGDEYPSVEYGRADLDELDTSLFEDKKFDFAFSSLALHYLVNLDRLVGVVNQVLKPGASFAFNVEHPIYTAPTSQKIMDDPETGKQIWAFSDYHKEGERVVDWLAQGVRKQHRTITNYMGTFLQRDFIITGFIEWLPTEEELKEGKVSHVEALRPLFLMMRVSKPV